MKLDAANKKKAEVVNKFDGLIHKANGQLIDPIDHHVVSVEDDA